MNTRVSSMPGTNSSTSSSTNSSTSPWTMPGWLMAALILIGTALLGPSLGGLSRPGFVIACGIVNAARLVQSWKDRLPRNNRLFGKAMFGRLAQPANPYDPTLRKP